RHRAGLFPPRRRRARREEREPLRVRLRGDRAQGSHPRTRRNPLMPIKSRYVFSASMDVEPAKEALFKTEELTLSIGGERKRIVIENEPRYGALYEIESPEVLVSDAWARAVEEGRWPGQVRQYTKNRRHVLYGRLGG